MLSCSHASHKSFKLDNLDRIIHLCRLYSIVQILPFTCRTKHEIHTPAGLGDCNICWHTWLVVFLLTPFSIEICKLPLKTIFSFA